jgi:hypothetical protein
MMFFTVFKAPAEGRTHVFRPNEPFAQIIVVPEEALFDLEEMNEEESAERELQARRIYIAARLWRRVLSGHRRPARCLTAHIGTCIEPRRKKRAKTSPDDTACLRTTPRRTQKTGPKGPVFARPIASFNHRDGRNRDDGGDGGGDNGDGGAGIAAALPRSETYSRGGDDGGGDIVPVGRFHLLTARRLIHQSLAVAN